MLLEKKSLFTGFGVERKLTKIIVELSFFRAERVRREFRLIDVGFICFCILSLVLQGSS